MAHKAPRNVRIESLRLFAIVAIAVFHTFQPLFSQATAWALAGDEGARSAAAAAGDIAAIVAASPVAVGALGFINLFGAFGNCVFFMISGYFLIPRCAQASRDEGYWRIQGVNTLRRAGVILISVALYALLALAIGRFITPLPGISLHETGWLLGGLEFIWVYLAVMVVSPLVGWAWERCRARTPAALSLAVLIYLVNAYIAFISPGDAERGLLEWRKLMSAVTYFAAFLIGGLIARRALHPATGRRVRVAALVAFAGALCVEIALSVAGHVDILVATSFKSTSAISCALAAISLVACAQPARSAASRRDALIRSAASSILGFYILQSMLYSLWRGGVDLLLADAARSIGTQNTVLCICAVLGAGLIGSLLVVAGFLAIDHVVRKPLLRALRLE